MTVTPQQQPIHSSFGATSTAQQVLADVDLHGMQVLVTGGYSGLGLATTRALLAAGAQVWVPALRPQLATHLFAQFDSVNIGACDLSDLESVERFSRTVHQSTPQLDILILGAGVMAVPERRMVSGWESHMAINHLGHYALIQHLWPLLADCGSRVISYSSAGHHLSAIRWDDMHFATAYDKWLAYGQSKTANALLAVHLNELGHRHGLRAYSVHPGSILTPLQRHMDRMELVERGWTDTHGNLVDPTFKSPEQGAATALWAATSNLVDDRGGTYCEDCNIAALAQQDASMEDGGVRQYAIDHEQAERLWQTSAEDTGLNRIR